MKKILLLVVVAVLLPNVSFASRLFGTAGDASTWVTWTGGTALYSQTNASIMCWFRHPLHSGSGAGNSFIYDQGNTVTLQRVELFLQGTNGTILAQWRDGTNIAQITTPTSFDDNLWHRLLVVRDSGTIKLSVYVDGKLSVSTSTEPGTSAVVQNKQKWGGNDNNDANGGFGGQLSRCATIAGVSLTPRQADSFLYTGRSPFPLTQWFEFSRTGASEADLSGNKLSGTYSATSISLNPPSL